jgi:hypothetical protein
LQLSFWPHFLQRSFDTLTLARSNRAPTKCVIEPTLSWAKQGLGAAKQARRRRNGRDAPYSRAKREKKMGQKQNVGGKATFSREARETMGGFHLGSSAKLTGRWRSLSHFVDPGPAT